MVAKSTGGYIVLVIVEVRYVEIFGVEHLSVVIITIGISLSENELNGRCRVSYHPAREPVYSDTRVGVFGKVRYRGIRDQHVRVPG